MDWIRPVGVIAAKDIVQRLRDRSVYIMGIVGPLLLVVILSATVGAADDVSAFEFGLASADDGEIAASFEAALETIEADDIIVLTVVDDRAALDALVDDGSVAAGFFVPAEFSRAVSEGASAELTVVGDPGSTIAVDVAQAIAETFVAELDYVAVGTAAALTADSAAPDAARIAEVTAAAMAQQVPIDVVPVEEDGRGQDMIGYYSISLSVLFLFFTVQFGVLSLMEEREVGTLDRILVSPISSTTVVLGKMASAFVVGLASMVVLIVATSLIVGAEWGSPVAVAALVAAGLAVAIALSIMVAGLAHTAEQAGAYATIAAMVLGLLGGVFFPVSQAPDVLARFSYISPHRWLLEGFRDVSYGAGIGSLGPTLAVLIGFVVLFGGLGLGLARQGVVRS